LTGREQPFVKERKEGNMERKEYEKTTDYENALQILKDFTNEVLGNDIDLLRTFCFDNLNKFVGDICDPDMYLIVQAIYIILWGNIYDLAFEKMGSWDWNGTYAFRGDTMNSFGSLFGKAGENNAFAYRAKYFGADKNPELWNKINEFYRMYHWLGNFIVLPNRGNVKYGINGARANFKTGMRDYFDWFLLSVGNYQEKVKSGDIHLSKFEMQLQQNPEYNPYFMRIEEWEEKFFLKHYFKDGAPKLLFHTPLERRLLITAEPQNRKGESYYTDEEYLELMEDYIDKSKEVIEFRTNKMVDFLKEKL